MKNLLHCHSKGLHSFPIELTESGLYKRIFYASEEHNLWRPFEIAIHPHHVDIKITVLEGILVNHIYEVSDDIKRQRASTLKKFKWNSHIKNGSGGFEALGEERLVLVSRTALLPGDTVIMKACELHTVSAEEGKVCVWMIEESKPTCEYFPINYSDKDLTTWSPEGLYVECDDLVKYKYIGKYLPKILPLKYGHACDYKFQSVKVTDELPSSDKEMVIAFEAGVGFQSAHYYNGSKTWKSLITGKTITVINWLKRV